MKVEYGIPQDIDRWMELVEEVSWNFPGLETREKLNGHRSTVLKFMDKRQALCVKGHDRILGVLLFSRRRNMICCLAVAPTHRRKGVGFMLLAEALRELDDKREITVSTFREDDEKGLAPRSLYEKFGFVPEALTVEMDYPNQRYILYPVGSEPRKRQLAVNKMVQRIARILWDREPSVYLYGSVVLNDFRPGWSDIDILVLTQRSISEQQAKELVGLRQALLEIEPEDPYYRSFEGGILPLDAFLTGNADRIVYWGTSGERITDRYVFDCFSRMELIESGVLLYGKEIRGQLKLPEYRELYSGVTSHYDAIRKYAGIPERSFYPFGWMLDIARCIYTLRTGKIIAKTEAGQWALMCGLCPDPDALRTAIMVRKAPLAFKNDGSILDYAEKLPEAIERYADALEKELAKAAERAEGTF